MAEKDRFTDDEWRSMVSAPGEAFLALVAGNHSGFIAMIKEGRAASKALKAARTEAGWPPVVEEMIAYMDEHRDELGSSGAPEGEADDTLDRALTSLSDAGSIAAALTPDELDGYVRWVIGVAEATAKAVTEKGSSTPISDVERELLVEMDRRLRRG